MLWTIGAAIVASILIDISVGKPIPVEGREADELMREVERWIEKEMRRLDPEAYGGRS